MSTTGLMLRIITQPLFELSRMNIQSLFEVEAYCFEEKGIVYHGIFFVIYFDEFAGICNIK